MVQALGTKGKLLLAFEDTYNETPAAPAAYDMPFNTHGLGDSQTLVKSNTIRGRTDPTRPGRGNIDDGGPVVVPVDVRHFPLWLRAKLGAPVTTNVSTAGTLTGATGVTTTIGTWTAVTDGAFKVAIDGSAATAVGPIDFSSGVTTMANVASKIQAAIRAVATGGFTNATVTWSDANTNFVITSGTTGASSAVSNLTAPASGTNISGATFMKCTAGTLVAGKALYQHVFKNSDTSPSAVIEAGNPDINFYALHNGMKVTSMGLSFALSNKELTANIELMGAKQTNAAASFVESATSYSFERFDDFQAIVKEGGVECAIITQIDINIDMGLDGDTFALGHGGYRSHVNKGTIAPTGTINAFFESAALLDKARNGTETSLEVILTNGDFSLAILMPEVLLERKTPGIEGPTGVKISLPYQAYFDNAAEDTSLQITVVNDVEAYAPAE